MNRIHDSELLVFEGWKVVTRDIIERYHTAEEVKAFYSWLRGKTCLVIDGGVTGIYLYDYEMWLAYTTNMLYG